MIKIKLFKGPMGGKEIDINEHTPVLAVAVPRKGRLVSLTEQERLEPDIKIVHYKWTNRKTVDKRLRVYEFYH